jgi:hypothetical protein
MDYDKWLQRFTGKLERVLFRFTMILVVLLFVVQAIHLNGYLRIYLGNNAYLERYTIIEDIQQVISGSVEREKALTVEEQAIVLELIPSPGKMQPELYLIINGEPYTPFVSGERLYLPVSPGDLLEVSGNVYGNMPAIIRIADVYGKLQSPQKGKEIITFGEKELIAWIIPE